MAARPWNALSLQAQDGAGVRSLRHRQVDGAGRRRHPDARPEDGFRQSDWHIDVNIVAVPGEESMGID